MASSTDPPYFRPARYTDLPRVAAIVHAAYTPYIALMGQPPGPMLDDYAQRLAAGQLWVTETQGTVIGVLVLETGRDALLIDNIAIDPAAHGTGLGSLCLAFAESEARQRGLPALRLYTNALMTENVAYYSRRGFVETHRAIEHGYDRIYMAKPVA